jgi:hypothetical protein
MINYSNCDKSTRASLTFFWQNQLLDTKNETARIDLNGFQAVFKQFHFLWAAEQLLDTQLLDMQLLDTQLLDTQLLDTQLLDAQLLDTSHKHVRQ